MELESEETLDMEVSPVHGEDDEPSSKVAELVARCGQGDSDALKEFFETYSGDIYNFPVRVFHLDEDAASDFFLYAFERLKEGNRFRSFQGRSSFRTWFYTVLRNLVIDWMRTIREIQTVNFSRVDEHGNEFRMIENTPDPATSREPEFEQESVLIDALSGLSMELRLIFKLSYIYYLDLDNEEFMVLQEKSGKSPGEILTFLAELKNILSEKEMKNIDSEDKITALYTNIIELKNKRDRLQSSMSEKKLAETYESLSNEYEINRLERSIEKKYQQREKLLEKKEKGHFIVRTPYRYISELLGIPEGSISVQMMRALEKLRNLV